VHVNGDVKPCCYATSTVGNLREHTLREIWLGEEMESVRKHVTANRLHPICVGASCAYVKDSIEGVGEAGASYEERLRRMAESGSIWAAHSFAGYLLNLGRALEALPYLRTAAERGHSGAMFSLGSFMLTGQHGVEADVPKAVALLESSARQKDTRAIYRLGCMYCAGEHVLQDVAKGTAMLKEAGERGSSAAWLPLSEVHGDDQDLALHYLKIAAQRGNQDARRALERQETAAVHEPSAG
jgi:TPR repeat protein